MKIKKHITFTELRSKGINSLDIEKDEIIAINSKNGQNKCIVTEDFLRELINFKENYNFKNNSLPLTGLANNQIKSFLGNEIQEKFKNLSEDFDMKLEKLSKQIQNTKEVKNEKSKK